MEQSQENENGGSATRIHKSLQLPWVVRFRQGSVMTAALEKTQVLQIMGLMIRCVSVGDDVILGHDFAQKNRDLNSSCRCRAMSFSL